MTDQVRVLVTIDTEEDDWARYHPRGASVENIGKLPGMVPLWDRWGVRPTYFVNHPPLASREASSILTDLQRNTDCEMAVHCHPWNSPPLGAAGQEPTTMMAQLTAEENLAKLSALTSLYQERFHRRPVSFRAGRWGFGPTVAGPLVELGYRVDSSVSPLIDWTEIGGPDYSRARQKPYRFFPARPLTPADDGPLLEVPTSVGFLSGGQSFRGPARAWLERSPLRHLKIVGILDLTGLLRRRWLSPETSSTQEMIRLCKALVRSGMTVLDVTFHSSSLLPGATPFVRDSEEKERFLGRLDSFFEYCRGEGFLFATVQETETAAL